MSYNEESELIYGLQGEKQELRLELWGIAD
jgi:hypothetical protein